MSTIQENSTEPIGEQDEYEYDAEAEAAAVAQSLGEQLWADILKAKAQSESAHVGTTVEQGVPSPSVGRPPSVGTSKTANPTTMTSTIQKAIELANQQPDIRLRLQSTIVPETDGKTLLAVLTNAAQAGKVEPKLAAALVDLISNLAIHARVLKGSMGRKRKRSESIDSQRQSKPRSTGPTTPVDARQNPTPLFQIPPSKIAAPPLPPLPPALPPVGVPDLTTQIGHATAIIHAALTHSVVQGIPLDANILASIQAPLHHVFLFAATSAVAGGAANVPILQEISGLIQILGVLHGVTIAPPATFTPFAQTHPNPSIPTNQIETVQSHFVDIGTAVYPCLFPSCGKTFSRLFHLRTHQEAHSFGKPFQCPHCSVAFTRKHDLKRHIKSHNTTVFRCGGCFRTFTRRDALKRHKTNKKSLPACVESPFEETIADDSELTSSSRRVKAVTPPPPEPADSIEEGELKKDLIIQTQNAVMILHPLLQGHVMHALATQNTLHNMSQESARAQPAHGVFPQVASLPPPVVPPEDAVPALLSGYNLNEEQTSLLQKAIAVAHEAARAQAELEAQLELGDDWDGPEEEDLPEVADVQGTAEEAE